MNIVVIERLKHCLAIVLAPIRKNRIPLTGSNLQLSFVLVSLIVYFSVA